MQTIKTIIADDVPRFVTHLEENLAKYCPKVNLVGKATSLNEAYQKIIELQPDLVILDIEFGGPTSFELLKRLKEENRLNFQVIFLTGYTETSHFINAFKYSALQYLLKPIDHEMLIETVDRAFEIISSKAENQMPEQVDVMIENVQTFNKKGPIPIMLKRIRKIYEKVLSNEIYYLESDTPMTNVYLTQNRTFKTIDLIGKYESLTVDANFFRISQSIIVNLDHVSQYKSLEKNISLTNGTVLTVSRQRDKELRRLFGI
jgi:two-component system, LytTR family, response regulator